LYNLFQDYGGGVKAPEKVCYWKNSRYRMRMRLPKPATHAYLTKLMRTIVLHGNSDNDGTMRNCLWEEQSGREVCLLRQQI
jgi:hypothetical protein